MVKAAFDKKKIFQQPIGLKFKEETNSATFGAQLCMVLKLGHFGK
jgi:hypothetical protein